jgi:hypothetical protein
MMYHTIKKERPGENSDSFVSLIIGFDPKYIFHRLFVNQCPNEPTPTYMVYQSGFYEVRIKYYDAKTGIHIRTEKSYFFYDRELNRSFPVDFNDVHEYCRRQKAEQITKNNNRPTPPKPMQGGV